MGARVTFNSCDFEGLLYAEAIRAPDLEIALPPVVFIHGACGGSWYWGFWLERFALAGHAAYAIDLRGHHGSRSAVPPDHGLGTVSIADYVTDVCDLLRAIAETQELPPVLVGHSMGGLVAQLVAADNYVATAGLVLIASAPPAGINLPFDMHIAAEVPFRDKLNAMNAALRKLPFYPSRKLMEIACRCLRDDSRMFDEVVDRFYRQPESGLAGRQIVTGAFAVDEAVVDVPRLVITGNADNVVVPSISEVIARKYDAQLEILPGRGHLPMLEKGRDEVADKIIAWIAEVVK